MEHSTLEIDTISAKDLNNVNLITKMDVYAVVSISGDPQKNDQKAKTPVDHEGNNNPTWNFSTKFTVDEIASNQNRLSLVFKLRCQRALGDKDIGEVHVPIKELLDSHSNGTKQFVSYQVRKPSGKPKGQLSFSYQFGDKISTGAKIDEPVTAYPAVTPGLMTGSTSVYPPPPVQGESGPYPPQGYGYSGSAPPLLTGYPQGGPAPAKHEYPPPPPGYGYPPPPTAAQYGGYPPPAGYGGYPPPPGYGGYPPQSGDGGYPPQSGHGVYPNPQSGHGGYPNQSGHGGYPNQSGHGYPPVQQPQQQQQQKKKNKFGLGLGAGLLGGALGGMLIGDALSDGCGFDGGFDF